VVGGFVGSLVYKLRGSDPLLEEEKPFTRSSGGEIDERRGGKSYWGGGVLNVRCALENFPGGWVCSISSRYAFRPPKTPRLEKTFGNILSV